MADIRKTEFGTFYYYTNHKLTHAHTLKTLNSTNQVKITPSQAVPMYLVNKTSLKTVQKFAVNLLESTTLFIPNNYLNTNLIWVVFASQTKALLKYSTSYQKWKNFIFNSKAVLPVNLQVQNHHVELNSVYQNGDYNVNAKILVNIINSFDASNRRLNRTPKLLADNSRVKKVPLQIFDTLNDAVFKQSIADTNQQYYDEITLSDVGMGYWECSNQGQRYLQFNILGGFYNLGNRTNLYQLQTVNYCYNGMVMAKAFQKIRRVDYTNTINVSCYNGRVEYFENDEQNGWLLKRLSQVFNEAIFSNVYDYKNLLIQHLNDVDDSDDDVNILNQQVKSQNEKSSEALIEPDSISSYIFKSFINPGSGRTNQNWLQLGSTLLYTIAMIMFPLLIYRFTNVLALPFDRQGQYTNLIVVSIAVNLAMVLKSQQVSYLNPKLNATNLRRFKNATLKRQCQISYYFGMGSWYLILSLGLYILGPLNTDLANLLISFNVLTVPLQAIGLVRILDRTRQPLTIGQTIKAWFKFIMPLAIIYLILFLMVRVII